MHVPLSLSSVGLRRGGTASRRRARRSRRLPSKRIAVVGRNTQGPAGWSPFRAHCEPRRPSVERPRFAAFERAALAGVFAPSKTTSRRGSQSSFASASPTSRCDSGPARRSGQIVSGELWLSEGICNPQRAIVHKWHRGLTGLRRLPLDRQPAATRPDRFRRAAAGHPDRHLDPPVPPRVPDSHQRAGVDGAEIRRGQGRRPERRSCSMSTSLFASVSYCPGGMLEWPSSLRCAP